MKYIMHNKTLTIKANEKIFVLDEDDFFELLVDFSETHYGNYAINRKYQDDKSVSLSSSAYVSFAKSANYFMPLIVEGYNMGGLGGLLEGTAYGAILESLNSLKQH